MNYQSGQRFYLKEFIKAITQRKAWTIKKTGSRKVLKNIKPIKGGE